FDVDQLPTHGGSLRVYARHAADGGEARATTGRVAELLERERAAGLAEIDGYRGFADKVKRTKRRLLEFLIGAKERGERVVAYGAPAKGNTLLNYCGVRTDFVEYTVDRSPHKQNHTLPGVGIPIHGPEKIFETRPDYVLILPWNLKEEIVEQMSAIRDWGGRFVVAIPELEVLE
ncbi:MAG: methyltransferase C-terminal domain-containing protein, partial [Acidobacteriota bacterium]